MSARSVKFLFLIDCGNGDPAKAKEDDYDEKWKSEFCPHGSGMSSPRCWW